MKRAISIIFAASLFAALVQAAVGSLWQAENRGVWTALAPMPSQRQEISTAVLDGRIFVIAGFNSSGNSLSTVEVYDPNTNSWSSAAPLPIANNHNAAAVAAGKLYAFGGVSNRTFVYNPQLNSWSDVASMRFQHANTAAVGVFNDKIYVAGGNGPNMNQTELEVYDPAANNWTQLASMAVPRNHTGGAFINGKFYVVGGRPGTAAASALEAYDPATNTWARLRDMPTGRSGAGVAAVNGELYVFGGELPRQFNEVEVYHPLTNAWCQLPPMPVPRHGLFASVIGNSIYLPGGATQQGLAATSTNDVFTVSTATTVSAASFAPSLTGKAIVAAFGNGLATTTAMATDQPLPTDLGGTTVRVIDRNGITRLAPLFFVSPEQINYQIPADSAAGIASVTITGGDGGISTGAIQLAATAPALFTLSQNGQGPAVALDGFTFTGPPFNAKRADGQPNIIVFFGSGLGADATDVDGNVAANVQLLIDGIPATVLYAGRAPGFTGLNQINALLPAGITSGGHSVRLVRNNAASNEVLLGIK